MKFDEFRDSNFDYIFAQSVLTHLPPKKINELFNNLDKIMYNDSKFIATFYKSDKISKGRKGWNYGYPISHFRSLNSRLKIVEIPSNHPKGHNISEDSPG